MQKIICTHEINNLEDLSKIKLYREVNQLEQPNFSELARQLNVDPRTVKNIIMDIKNLKIEIKSQC